jgi:uncharacterized protein (TIGR03000 family)
MYSLVLMAALTTAPEAEGFGGSWYNHCTLDSCLPIRYGWKPYGCVMHTPIHIPYGCYGCGGCHGHYGHWNGCYGSGCYGYGLGYWHADAWSYGAGYGGFGAYGNYGNFGSYSLYPSGASTLNLTPTVIDRSVLPNPSGSGGVVVPNMPSTIGPGGSLTPTPYDPLTPRKQIRDVREFDSTTTTANIVVEVPEGAIVYIDGNKMKSTAARRVFTTPPIEKGQDYFYTVRVVVEQNGRKIEDSQKVTVRGGEETAASFAHLKKNDGNALVGR